MSVSGILSSAFSNYGSQSVQNSRQQFRQDFQQLGQDLQAGNLAAAQSDFATLEQDAPQRAASSSGSNNPIAQAFNQLSQDLQSGNLAAAQQDYATIQQDFRHQPQAPQPQLTPPNYRHRGSGGSGQQQNPIAKLFSELGQALQSGDLTTAQQAYSSLQQDFQNFAGANASASASTSQSGSNGLQVTA